MAFHQYMVHLGIRFAGETVGCAHQIVDLYPEGAQEVFCTGAITMGRDEVEPAALTYRRHNVSCSRHERRRVVYPLLFEGGVCLVELCRWYVVTGSQLVGGMGD